MTYQTTWTNSAESGRLAGGASAIKLSDGQELADAINRRRLLTYQASQSFASHIFSGANVRRSLLATAGYPPLDNFRANLIDKILDPPLGAMAEPSTPAAMEWLWPIAGADENKPIVSGTGTVPPGKVGLLPKINGTSNWTDPSLTPGATSIRAVHFNELRSAVEFIRRGRWVLPVYFSAGLFSLLPNTSWAGGFVANNDFDEVRSVGYCVFRNDSAPPLGLTGATIRDDSFLELTADLDCRLEVYHCLRPLDWEAHPPNWNKYNPGAGASWASAGGLGAGDSTLIGTLTMTAGQANALSTSQLRQALQNIVNGAEQNFIVRRADTGDESVGITASVTVVFDLISPPN